MARTLKISPVNRVEGDLEVRVDIEEGKVTEAWASGVMFRGFEALLKGRDSMDGIVLTPRICGICCSAHSTAAANALRFLNGSTMPANAYFGRNIVFGTETVMSHLTHFYALFAPDLTNEAYAFHTLHDELVKRFTPFQGTSYQKVLKERKRFLEIIGLFAGKWPNHLSFQPGGMTCTLGQSEIIRAQGVLADFQGYIEETILGTSIERWLDEIDSLEKLEEWAGQKNKNPRDLALFIQVAQDIGLYSMGKGPEKFLSFGAYEMPDQTFWLPSGFYDGRQILAFDQDKITEDSKNSWFIGSEKPQHPFDGTTKPEMDKPDAYSWIKAPRYDNQAVEVGPLARQIINQEPLVIDLFNKLGAHVFTRTIARWHEAMKTLKELKHWLDAINIKKPFYKVTKPVDSGSGAGLVEAARGCLGHWLVVENNKIKKYQVITPTTWNASPRDGHNTPGAMESALAGLSVNDEKNPVEISHVIRSFDPCLVCSVHTIRNGKKSTSFTLRTY